MKRSLQVNKHNITGSSEIWNKQKSRHTLKISSKIELNYALNDEYSVEWEYLMLNLIYPSLSYINETTKGCNDTDYDFLVKVLFTATYLVLGTKYLVSFLGDKVDQETKHVIQIPNFVYILQFRSHFHLYVWVDDTGDEQ